MALLLYSDEGLNPFQFYYGRARMIHTRIYATTDVPVRKTGLTSTIKVSRGIDWMLEDFGTRAQSYSILEQTSDVSGQMVMKLSPRPTDWVGTLYLDTAEQEVEIVKQDSKAIWVRQKGLEYVHWYSDVAPGVIEAWKRLF